LPKDCRILKRPEYLRLGEDGQRLIGKFFILVYAPSKHSQSRIGITATKKIGPAITRNRIKRVCREFFRIHRHQLAASLDVHIIARSAAARAANNELTISLEKLFSQIA